MVFMINWQMDKNTSIIHGKSKYQLNFMIVIDMNIINGNIVMIIVM